MTIDELISMLQTLKAASAAHYPDSPLAITGDSQVRVERKGYEDAHEVTGVRRSATHPEVYIQVDETVGTFTNAR